MPATRQVAGPASLRQALLVGDRAVVAFVGAGGKTTAMCRLADELRARGARVVVTTTTRIVAPAAGDGRDVVLARRRADALRAIRRSLDHGRLPVLGAAVRADGKLVGVGSAVVAALAADPEIDHVLVEADGAAGRSFKAPRRHEPAIPPAATVVVTMVGVDAVGRRLALVAHHARPIAALTGASPGDLVDASIVARVMTDPRGGAKGVPRGARLVHLVNKVDTPRRLIIARSLAAELRRAGAARVVLAACRRRRGPVVAVVSGRRQARMTGRAADRSRR